MQITEVKTTKIVACIFKKKNKILISSRPYPKPYYGFYEFPGGKVKKDEYNLEALKREIFEELSVKLNLNKLIFIKSYLVKRKNERLILNFFFTSSWLGKIKPSEKQNIRWIDFNKINTHRMLSSNKLIIKFLKSLHIFP
mgnify:CR=1 FL=1|tara:strand:+ start:1264 stop:1683 length:420 start_codon:yes stop_codon:yes gene_type:complete